MPKCREQTGLEEGQVTIGDGAMRGLIRSYAREAGVRNLQQQLEKIHRKVSLQVVRGEVGTEASPEPSTQPLALTLRLMGGERSGDHGGLPEGIPRQPTLH